MGFGIFWKHCVVDKRSATTTLFSLPCFLRKAYFKFPINRFFLKNNFCWFLTLWSTLSESEMKIKKIKFHCIFVLRLSYDRKMLRIYWSSRFSIVKNVRSLFQLCHIFGNFKQLQHFFLTTPLDGDPSTATSSESNNFFFSFWTSA